MDTLKKIFIGVGVLALLFICFSAVMYWTHPKIKEVQLPPKVIDRPDPSKPDTIYYKSRKMISENELLKKMYQQMKDSLDSMNNREPENWTDLIDPNIIVATKEDTVVSELTRLWPTKYGAINQFVRVQAPFGAYTIAPSIQFNEEKFFDAIQAELKSKGMLKGRFGYTEGVITGVVVLGLGELIYILAK